MARTPSDLRAAMLARPGTLEGLMECPTPCRVRKATRVPEGRLAMVIGELGNPQGCCFDASGQSPLTIVVGAYCFWVHRFAMTKMFSDFSKRCMDKYVPT